MQNLIKVNEKLELRVIEPTFENATTMFELVDKNRTHLLPYMEWASHAMTSTPEDSFMFLIKCSQNRKNKCEFAYGIFLEDRLVGSISIFGISEVDRVCEFGYWIDKDVTGKGIITLSIKAIEKIAFLELGFNRLIISCDKRNLPSINVAKRNGYIWEGESRECKFNAFEGAFVTLLRFSKLKSEYDKAHNVNN